MSLYFDSDAAEAVLKQDYTTKEIQTLTYQSSGWSMIPKDESGEGEVYVGPIRSATASSASADAATAFGDGGPSIADKWLCPWKLDYASANITGQIISATRNSSGAFVKAMKFEVDGAFKTVGIRNGSAIWGNGGGALAVLDGASDVTTAIVTLKNKADIVKFFRGQVIQAATTDGTSGAVEAGTVTLLGVNVNTGDLKCVGASWDTGIPTIANTDFLFMKGDFGRRISGIPAWVPTADPGVGTVPGTLNGVDRTTDPVRLGGFRYNGKGAPKSRTLTRLAINIAALGGRPDKVFVNPVDYADLLEELMGRVVYGTATAFEAPQVAFETIKLATPVGMIDVVQDPFVPQGFAWMLQMDTWAVVSMGACPRILGKGADDIEWLRQPLADAYQLRIGGYLTVYCSAPGYNGVAQF